MLESEDCPAGGRGTTSRHGREYRQWAVKGYDL